MPPDKGSIVEAPNASAITASQVEKIIDPKLALPTHLQDALYIQDIWRRLKSSPTCPPAVTKWEMREDHESRDLVHAILYAAVEREKEVLLHNQARLFSAFLIKMGEAIGRFLNTPIIPVRGMRLKSPRESKARASDHQSGDAKTAQDEGESRDDSDGKSSKQGWALGVLSAVLMPKTLLIIAILAAGSIAGWTHVQIKNLEDTIASYKTSVGILGEQEKHLQAKIKTFEEEQNNSRQELEAARADLLSEQKRSATLSAERNGAMTESEALREKLTQAEAKIEDYESKVPNQQSIAESLRAKAQEAQTLSQKVNQLEAELNGTKKASGLIENAMAAMRTASQQAQSRVAQLQTELAAAALLQTENSRLRSDLEIARIAIQRIKEMRDKYDPIRANDLDWGLKYYFNHSR